MGKLIYSNDGDEMKHGLICGRFQPLHHGHISLIKMAMRECDLLTIAVGSAQDTIDERNPFTYALRSRMIRNIFKEEIISGKIHVVPVKDINNPPLWVDRVLTVLKVYSYTPQKVDIYFAGTPDDAALFGAKGIYTILLPREQSFCKSGTEIRELVKLGDENWKKHVPEENWDIVDPFKFRDGDVLIERRAMLNHSVESSSDVVVSDYTTGRVFPAAAGDPGEILGVIRKGVLIPTKKKSSGFVSIDEVFEVLDSLPVPPLVEKLKTMIIGLNK